MMYLERCAQIIGGRLFENEKKKLTQYMKLESGTRTSQKL
jgi:hypothetical protein